MSNIHLIANKYFEGDDDDYNWDSFLGKEKDC